jgi:protein-S-isoprenylcysteine O-methyltransferase Ste14
MEIPSLGRRGAGWVVLQMVALACMALAGLAGPPWPAPWSAARMVLGLVFAVAGGVLGVLGIRALGPSLTALPHPAAGAELRRHGVYARARHPIYGALLLVGIGWCLLTSWWAIVPWACLLAILLAKSEREEAWLTDRFEAYLAYRSTVRRRFVPFVF